MPITFSCELGLQYCFSIRSVSFLFWRDALNSLFSVAVFVVIVLLNYIHWNQDQGQERTGPRERPKGRRQNQTWAEKKKMGIVNIREKVASREYWNVTVREAKSYLRMWNKYKWNRGLIHRVNRIKNAPESGAAKSNKGCVTYNNDNHKIHTSNTHNE